MQRFEDFCVERFDIDPDGTPTREDILDGRFPAAVLVHGDTSSAMAAALSAFHLRIPVMHVEAGLRTGGSNLTPFPEELNRAGDLAHRRDCTSPRPRTNLAEPRPRERPGRADLRHRQHRHRRAALGLDDRRPVRQPRAAGAARQRPRGSSSSPPTGGRTGATGCAASPRASRALADAEPEVHFVLPVHPNPRVREVLTERLPRPRQRAADRAARLRDLRRACSAAPTW